MMTLDDAWSWYETTRLHLRRFSRLGDRYWLTLPWDGPLGRDDSLRSLEPETIVSDAQLSLDHLDDFAVLILFSVFESIVREKVVVEMQSEIGLLSQPHLLRLIEEALDQVRNGPAFRVLELFKGIDPDLVEEVNQVRQYRNWVAHGRRNDRPANVTPRTAHDRLSRFLGSLFNPPTAP